MSRAYEVFTEISNAEPAFFMAERHYEGGGKYSRNKYGSFIKWDDGSRLAVMRRTVGGTFDGKNEIRVYDENGVYIVVSLKYRLAFEERNKI